MRNQLRSLNPPRNQTVCPEHSSERLSPLEKDHASFQQEPESKKSAPVQGFGSADRDDPPVVTKLVPIPGSNASVDATGNLGQKPRCRGL